MISLGHKCKKGFTLIELLVVVAIIGILTSIGVVAYNKYTTIAQVRAIKMQNKEMNDFIKNTILTQCINYSDQVSLTYTRSGKERTYTKSCNNSFSGNWGAVANMSSIFKQYFQSDPNFKNVILGQMVAGTSISNPYGMGGSCPNFASAELSMKPGNHCISYESTGSYDMSKNDKSTQPCHQKYSFWILIASKLPDNSYFFSCVGKTWG